MFKLSKANAKKTIAGQDMAKLLKMEDKKTSLMS
jgi:hypothetical protein